MITRFLGKRILFITAHPDDESFLAAGTLLANKNAGGQSFLICATYGEKGASHLPRPVTPRQLKAMRKKELFAVSKFLGISRVWALGMPDGNLQSQKKEFFKKSLTLVQKIKPETIISFGADGITGHHDHIAAAKIARHIAKKVHVPYFAFCLSPRSARHAHQWLSHRRRSNCYHHAITFQKPVCKIPVASRLKLQALRFHKSQQENGNPFVGIPAYVKKDFLTAEYFTR